MKIAVVTCYYEPDYVRNLVMRQALASHEDVELIIIKNTHRGFLKYHEVFWKTFRVKFKEKPDAYFLTFRGQEMLPFILALAGKKPVWLDEFIVPGAYLKQEKRKGLAYKVKVTILRAAVPIYNFFLRRCSMILADTKEHAELSSEISKINLDKYLVVPVGTDENIFYPDSNAAKSEKFTIFYYSSVMQSLLGVPQVLEAAEKLKDDKDIEFIISGGKQKMKSVVEKSMANGANIKYLDWIPFEDIGKIMRESSLVLGGPFGGTPQAHKVITGKTFQALACASPTVVGESKTIKAYFTDKVNCLMVMQNDSDALVKAFTWAKDHPNELSAIAFEGRKLYEQKFSIKEQTELVKPLIDSIR